MTGTPESATADRQAGGPGRANGGAAHSARAFSLLELIIVMAIVAVLSAIAVPRMAAAASRYRAELAARRIAADLDLARRRAASASASRALTFDLTNQTYALAGERALDGGGSYTVSLAGDPYQALIESVWWTGNGNMGIYSGTTTITYNGYGLPDRGGTLLVRSGGSRFTVVIDAQTGKVNVQ